jgi:hypothetical protein
MSEYQYYEFQTIDRLLTGQEQQEVNALSSHIDVTSSRAVVTYNWGDFKHDPRTVVASYFDAFLYTANWGTRRLIFRFPKALLEPAKIEPYCVDDNVSLTAAGRYWLLEIEWHEEGGWSEPEGELSGLIQLRNDILEGDYRVLYLAWLMAATAQGWFDMDEEEPEPPVPAGLQHLTPALRYFVEFFGIDPHLVQSAAAASPAPEAALSDKALKAAIAQLPPEESRDFLFRLARGEAGLHLALRHRLLALIEPPAPAKSQPRSRTLAQLKRTAEQQRQEDERRQAEAAEKRRIEGLELLAKRETQIWPAVEVLIQRGQSKAYDDAVAQLLQLRELADYQHTQAEFRKRVQQLASQYRSRYSFVERLQKAGLV